MIRRKLILWNCIVLTILLAVIGAAIYFMTRRSMLNAVDAALTARANFLLKTWRGPMDEERLRRARERLPQALAAESAEDLRPEEIKALQIQRLASQTIYFDLKGIGIVEPNERPRSPEGFQQAVGGVMTIHDTTLGDGPARTIDVPLRRGGNVVQVAEFTASLGPTYTELQRLERTLLLVLPLSVGIMLVAGVVLTRRALKPIADISSTANRIGATNLRERLPSLGSDEFGQLSESFNTMLTRIDEAFRGKDEAFRRQKEFTADASHELKTPLTAIRTRAELALRKELDPAKYRDHMQAIDRAARAMSALVQDLLLLTTSDEGRSHLAFDSFLVASLVQDALAAVDPQDRHVQVKVPEDISITGNRNALARVLTNLLDNSVRHTAPEGSITIEAVQRDSKVDVTVRDDGEGIPEEEVARVFDRFHRVDRSRNRDSGGTGLGLAIAKAIVEAHGGTIELKSRPNEGTAVTVSLPAAAAKAPAVRGH
jgi:heavy metal sensor kinase